MTSFNSLFNDPAAKAANLFMPAMAFVANGLETLISKIAKLFKCFTGEYAEEIALAAKTNEQEKNRQEIPGHLKTLNEICWKVEEFGLQIFQEKDVEQEQKEALQDFKTKAATVQRLINTLPPSDQTAHQYQLNTFRGRVQYA